MIWAILGTLILDLEARDLTAVASHVVEEFAKEGIIPESLTGELIRILSYRHKYVTDNYFKGIKGMRKNASQRSLQVRKKSLAFNLKHFFDILSIAGGVMVEMHVQIPIWLEDPTSSGYDDSQAASIQTAPANPTNGNPFLWLQRSFSRSDAMGDYSSPTSSVSRQDSNFSRSTSFFGFARQQSNLDTIVESEVAFSKV